MNKKYKVLLPLILGFLSLILSGCVIGLDKEDIYDDNDKINNEGDSYSFHHQYMSIGKSHLDLEYSKFYGAATVWSLYSEKDSVIDIEFDSVVETGRFKLVIVDEDNNVIDVLENSIKGNQQIKTSVGKYLIKIVGDNSKGEIKINIVAGEGIDTYVAMNRHEANK